MSSQPGPRSFACAPCEVTWKSTDPECWMCGHTADTTPLTDSTRPDTAHMITPSAPTGSPLTRWGTNVAEAHAMGLPDPRCPVPPRVVAA